MSNIYFDNAATTKIDQSVINLMNNVMTNNYGNPNSTHSFGRSSRTLVEKARKGVKESFIQNQIDTIDELLSSTKYKLENLG